MQNLPAIAAITGIAGSSHARGVAAGKGDGGVRHPGWKRRCSSHLCQQRGSQVNLRRASAAAFATSKLIMDTSAARALGAMALHLMLSASVRRIAQIIDGKDFN